MGSVNDPGMALGNWYHVTVLARVDKDRSITIEKKNLTEVTDGRTGHVFEVYKNWIYIMKPGEDTAISEIDSGNGWYGNFRYIVHKIDEGRSRIYFVIDLGDRTELGDCRYLIGSAGYGYDDEEWVGFTFHDEFRSWLVKHGRKIISYPDDKIEHFASEIASNLDETNQAKSKLGWTIPEMLGIK